MAELGSDRSSAGAGSVLLISAANHSPPSVSVGLGKLGESDRYSLQLHSIHTVPTSFTLWIQVFPCWV